MSVAVSSSCTPKMDHRARHASQVAGFLVRADRLGLRCGHWKIRATKVADAFRETRPAHIKSVQKRPAGRIRAAHTAPNDRNVGRASTTEDARQSYRPSGKTSSGAPGQPQSTTV